MKKQLSDDTEAAMGRLVGGLKTKSDKIRILAGAKYERADIARYLNIKYQHVRNVLVNDEKKREMRRSKKNDDSPPKQTWTQVGIDGRLVIPAAYRQCLGLDDGGHVLMVLEENEIRLIGREGAIARAQELVAPYVKDESTSTETFLAERRREAQRETSRG